MIRTALRIALVAATALTTSGCYYYPYGGYYPYGYRYGYPGYVARPAPVVVYPGY